MVAQAVSPALPILDDGHRDGYLFRIVLSESLILSVLGFLPGVATSQPVARNATLLPCPARWRCGD